MLTSGWGVTSDSVEIPITPTFSEYASWGWSQSSKTETITSAIVEAQSTARFRSGSSSVFTESANASLWSVDLTVPPEGGIGSITFYATGTEEVDVEYWLVEGPANGQFWNNAYAGIDYEPVAGTVHLTPGDPQFSSVTIPFSLIEDVSLDGRETLHLVTRNSLIPADTAIVDAWVDDDLTLIPSYSPPSAF